MEANPANGLVLQMRYLLDGSMSSLFYESSW